MNTPNSGDRFTTDRFSERAHESVDQIAETVGDAEERIRHGVEDTADRVRYAGHNAKERSDEALRSVNTFVQGNPLISLALAFAAGSLLSMFRRRS